MCSLSPPKPTVERSAQMGTLMFVLCSILFLLPSFPKYFLAIFVVISLGLIIYVKFFVH